MLKEIYETGRLYGYSLDYSGEGVGIVLADNEEDAKATVIQAYTKHGYPRDSFTDLEVWKLDKNCFFSDSPNILEIY